MEHVEETKERRRFGLFRWLIVLLIVINVFAARAIAPILPAIEVPAEKITLCAAFFGYSYTNCSDIYGEHQGADTSLFNTINGLNYAQIAENMNLFKLRSILLLPICAKVERH